MLQILADHQVFCVNREANFKVGVLEVQRGQLILQTYQRTFFNPA